MNGILNIYKETDFTSNDVVAKLRGICHMRKIGHTGTLDPNATGVLPVCLGTATKLCDILAEHDKVYEAQMQLGLVSDTQDIWGEVIKKSIVSVTETALIDAIMSFVGEYDQVPPMYSAKKVNGQKLYELARKGITVERKGCRVQIFDISIVNIDLPMATIKVHCGKGTYIRTLIHDIGQKLGCGAVMTSLVRERVGAFNLETAKTLKELEDIVKKEELCKVIIPVDKVFDQLESITLTKELDRYIYNGNPLLIDNNLADISKCRDGQRFRVYDSNNVFQGIYELDFKKKMYKPWKMFLEV